MTEKPRRIHFGSQIAERMARAQGMLNEEPQYNEYEHRCDREAALWKRVKEKMKMEAGD